MALDPYAGATDHYTSPDRRDWVKRVWEEPAFVAHLDAAIRQARDLGLRTELEVLDIGCGTGVAIDLLLEVPALDDGTATLVRATGLDLDTELLDIARARFAADPRISFAFGDMREVPDVGAHDLLLSSGVPYSHLDAAQLETALVRLFSVTVGRGRPSLAVVDVLGRWSIEWTERWAVNRWDYRMSFFATEEDTHSTPMTTWSGSELRALLQRAATRAGVEILTLKLVDRSLTVGRHTSTGEYTPGLPPIRDLINALADPAVAQDADALRLTIPLPDAPSAVHELHRELATSWNAAIDQHLTGSDGTGPDAQLALARRLLALERTFEQHGSGVGHSLTAFCMVGRP